MWFNLLDLPARLGFDFILPGTCYDSYNRRLLVNALWPFVLIFATVIGGAVWELAYGIRTLRGACAAMQMGLQRTLPLILILSFVLLPSQSTRILKTFLCTPFAYDDINGISKRYLHDDFSVSCDSPEYENLRLHTVVLLAIWPVAIPLLYIILLWSSRKALLSGKSTSLSRAIGFLHVDYGTELARLACCIPK